MAYIPPSGDLSCLNNKTKNIFFEVYNTAINDANYADVSEYMCQNLKKILVEIKNKNLTYPMTFTLAPNPYKVHFATYVIHINKNGVCEFAAINAYEGSLNSAILNRIKLTVSSVYPHMKLKPVDVSFLQTGGDVCGFMSAVTTRFFDRYSLVPIK